MFGFYSPVNETKVRVTIVGEHTDGMLRIAVARCSAKDNFVKKYGRGRALKRLSLGKLYKTILLDDCSPKAFVEIAKQVAEEVILSKVVYTEDPSDRVERLLNDKN